ncbi:Uncharacterised protein [Klebsiella pneumoniae]|nr:Uncharacterised protein [Klebsiella pneumoniae]
MRFVVFNVGIVTRIIQQNALTGFIADTEQLAAIAINLVFIPRR